MVHVVSVTVSWPTIDRASTDYDLHLSVSVGFCVEMHDEMMSLALL